MIDFAEFAHALLAWYDKEGRVLSWRKITDPYEIWVSEIMLQQTQVPRVQAHFYPQFLQRFPDVWALAQSSWEDVYPFWKGLGYYGRGKNLLCAAQQVVLHWNGNFPSDQKELQKLPGVGKYTSHAICAFAFNLPIAAIDTNLMKILSFLWPDLSTEIAAQKILEHCDGGRNFNNAMMDLGTALREKQVLPESLQRFFPANTIAFSEKIKPKKTTITKKRTIRIEVGIACIHRGGKYLIQARPEGKSFTGEWEFPGGKREKWEDFRACVKREVLEELGIEVSVRPHFFEQVHHFEKVNLVLRFHRCQIQSGEPKPLENQQIQWVSPSEFSEYSFLDTNHLALKKLQNIR